jgi:hypothetical protein
MTTDRVNAQAENNEASHSPLKIALWIFVVVFAFYFLIQFFMNGVLVEIEEKQERGDYVFTGDECRFAELANWVTGRNVPCVPTKVVKTD